MRGVPAPATVNTVGIRWYVDGRVAVREKANWGQAFDFTIAAERARFSAMKSKRIVVLAFLILLGTVATLGAATQPKFRSSGSADSGVGRYLVTLSAEADAVDLAATKGELAALYGARLEPDAPAGVRQLVVTMTAARARLMSSDPRVSEVADAPTTQPAPSAPSPTRHFTPHIAGYGDNGQSGIYTYDGSGNITAIGTDTYLYDLEGRLKASVTPGVEENYTYDAFGNRKTATGAVNCLGQTTCSQPVAVDTPTNRLQTINGNAVQYDAAGSVMDIAGTPSTHYIYGGTSIMTEATVGSDDRQFIYTADDERIAVKRGTSWTWSVRDLNQKVLREFSSAETGGANFAMTSRDVAERLHLARWPDARHNHAKRNTPLPFGPPRHTASHYGREPCQGGRTRVLPLWRGNQPHTARESGRGDEVYRARTGHRCGGRAYA